MPTAMAEPDQQRKTIRGVIKDVDGESIIGANVTEKGTTNGTISDFDGGFSLVVGNNATIVVSYIGYLTQELQVAGRDNFNITLSEDNTQLQEVVVTAFATQKKVNVTGAVADEAHLDVVPVI